MWKKEKIRREIIWKYYNPNGYTGTHIVLSPYHSLSHMKWNIKGYKQNQSIPLYNEFTKRKREALQIVQSLKKLLLIRESNNEQEKYEKTNIEMMMFN